MVEKDSATMRQPIFFFEKIDFLLSCGFCERQHVPMIVRFRRVAGTWAKRIFTWKKVGKSSKDKNTETIMVSILMESRFLQSSVGTHQTQKGRTVGTNTSQIGHGVFRLWRLVAIRCRGAGKSRASCHPEVRFTVCQPLWRHARLCSETHRRCAPVR